MSSNQIVVIDHKTFGVEETTAKNIESQFRPMLDKMVELETEFNEIVNLNPEDPETPKKAKELRLKYVKVRTGTEKIHKEQKSFYLNGGKFVDGWKNAQLFASQGKESKLEELEKYWEKKETERLEKLQNERAEILRPFVEDTTAYDLANMQEDVFEALLSTKKQAKTDREEAEKKAEEERQEAERRRILGEERKNEIIELYQYMDRIPEEYKIPLSEMSANGFKELKIILNTLKRKEELFQSRKVEIARYSKFYNLELKGYIPLEVDTEESDYLNLIEALKTRQTEYELEQEKIRLENERLLKEKQEQERVEEEKRKKLAARMLKMVGLWDFMAPEYEGVQIQDLDENMFNEMLLKLEKKRGEKEKADQLAREEQTRIENELAERKKAEQERNNQEQERIRLEKEEKERLAKATIKEQLLAWVDSFTLPDCPTEIANHELTTEIEAKMIAFKTWSTNQINSL